MSDKKIGGLVGGAAALSTATARAVRKTYGFVANPDSWALRLVFFAGIVTILKKAGVPISNYVVIFGVALGIAALLYEMSASRAMMRAFWEGRPFSMLCNGLIWAVAFGFSVNNWIGAASEGQAEKTNLHKAAFNASADTRKAVIDIENEVKRLEGKYDWSKGLDAPDSYEARIKAAEADARYEETRGGCKSKCIQKQQLAASLKAERANAIDRATTAEEIKGAKQKLEEARQTAANTKVETSEERNDLLILTDYAGFSEKGAQIFNGLFSIIVVSIFLSFGSMRDEMDLLRKTVPRTRANLGLKLRRWFMRTFFGREPSDVTVIENHTEHGAKTENYTVKLEDDTRANQILDMLREAAANAVPRKLAAV